MRNVLNVKENKSYWKHKSMNEDVWSMLPATIHSFVMVKIFRVMGKFVLNEFLPYFGMSLN